MEALGDSGEDIRMTRHDRRPRIARQGICTHGHVAFASLAVDTGQRKPTNVK